MIERILVAGGDGFLGKNVTSELLLFGYKNIFVPKIEQYDLRHAEEVNKLFFDVEPQIVINLAAVVGGIRANMNNPGSFFHDNLTIGMNLIHAARNHGALKFVQMGSACEYPKDAPMPLKEESIWDGYPEATNAPYGIAKRALLAMGQAYRKQYGLNVIHLVPTNLYGPGDNFGEDSHFIPAMIRRAAQALAAGKDEVELWGTGTATRDFLYVRDAAEAVVLAMSQYNSGEPVNLGSGREVSIREAAQKIAWLSGFEGKLVWKTDMPDGQPRRVLDTSRARQFGWEASTLLEAGLSRTISWYNTRAALWHNPKSR